MPKCQFLFSAVFGSRKVLLRIFSELHETKAKPPIFPRDTRSQKGKPGGGPRPPNHMLARLGPQARREVRREPRTSTDIAPSPIYCLRRENPKKSKPISMKSSAAPPPSTTSFGGQNLCSGTLPGRGIAPGVISIDTTAIFIAAADSHDEEGVVLPEAEGSTGSYVVHLSLSWCDLYVIMCIVSIAECINNVYATQMILSSFWSHCDNTVSR